MLGRTTNFRESAIFAQDWAGFCSVIVCEDHRVLWKLSTLPSKRPLLDLQQNLSSNANFGFLQCTLYRESVTLAVLRKCVGSTAFSGGVTFLLSIRQSLDMQQPLVGQILHLELHIVPPHS